jgi:hypothetical protein
LEGLEISVVAFSEINLGDRADAEYYSKENLAVKKALQNHLAEPLSDFCDTVASAFYPPATDLYDSGDTPFARCVDCINYPIITRGQDEQFKHIPKSFIADNTSVRVVGKGDIILTKVGTPGYASVVEEHDVIALSRTVLGLVNVREISPYYLMTFLRSRYGFSQLMRERELTIQYQLTLDRVRQISVYAGSQELRDAVDRTVIAYQASHQASQHLYVQAENLLLDALGLRDWQPPQPLSYERSASAAFAAGRLDAEHFQPQYAALFTLLTERGDIRLGDYLTERVRRGISPQYTEDGDVLVINSRHVGKTHVDVETGRYTSRKLLELQPEARGEVHRDDVLLNSTGRDTIGRCQCLLDDVEAVVDNHIAIIRPTDELDPVYLACYLNALPGQMQTERGWTGSSGQIELRPDVVEDYRVWKAPTEIQQEIRAKVEQSHLARRQAKQLLEAAKRAVEIAIEDSEAVALQFLKEVRGAFKVEEA